MELWRKLVEVVEELLVQSKLVVAVLEFPVPVCCTGSVRAEVVVGPAGRPVVVVNLDLVECVGVGGVADVADVGSQASDVDV